MSAAGWRQLWHDLQAGKIREQSDDLPLFGAAHEKARRHDSPTSHAAYDPGTADTQRRLILLALEANGPMTSDEIDHYLDWRPTTAGRRMGELQRAGMARTTGDTRPTRSGKMADVWMRTEARAA